MIKMPDEFYIRQFDTGRSHENNFMIDVESQRTTKYIRHDIAALQTRTPPVPVDTINIKRDVLQEFMRQVEHLKLIHDNNHDTMGAYLHKAIVSLDAVLAEGE